MSSLAINTRQLLRHLDTPKRLRYNALVAHVFQEYPQEAALTAVRAAVHRALDTLVAETRYAKRDRVLRYHAIVTRYDLGGEKAWAVAADLGLSMRHFYRERNAACVDLGALLQRTLPARSSAGRVSSVYEVAEAAAHAIYLAGAPDRAVAQLLALSQATTDPLARIAALCDAALILVELYDAEGSRRLIDRASRILQESDLSPAAVAEAQSIITFMQALGLWDSDADNGVSLALHTMLSPRRYMLELSAPGLRYQAGERMRYACRALACNDPIGAMKLLRESEPFIDLLGQRAPFLRIDYANIRGGVELRGGGEWEKAANLATTAYDESRKQGYLTGAATAAKALAYMLARNGDDRAVELADAVVELARSDNSPRLLAYAQIGAAEIYNLMNLHSRALDLVRDAAGELHGEQLQLQRAHAVRDRALTGLRSGMPQAISRV